jgi:hypothetical protein
MNNANKPEWMTTISIDISYQSEWLFISVFYYQKADNTKPFAACKVKLSEWCNEKSASGFVELENGAGKLFLKSEYVNAILDYNSDDTMQIQSTNSSPAE